MNDKPKVPHGRGRVQLKLPLFFSITFIRSAHRTVSNQNTRATNRDMIR